MVLHWAALQSPAVELTVPEMERAAYVFEQSLRFLAERFPRTRIYVVYIPSPLACYDIVSSKISIERQRYFKSSGQYDSRLVARNSDLIAGLISGASARCHAPFIDARPMMRAAAKTRLIHGPRDWFHPNALGYAALGDAILAGLRASP